MDKVSTCSGISSNVKMVSNEAPSRDSKHTWKMVPVWVKCKKEMNLHDKKHRGRPFKKRTHPEMLQQALSANLSSEDIARNLVMREDNLDNSAKRDERFRQR